MNVAAIIIGIVVGLLILAAIGGIGWYIFMKARYRTVPSNEALIITGPNLGDPEKEPNVYQDDQGKYLKVIKGGGHRLGMFQTATRISLTSFKLDISTSKVNTLNGVEISAQGVATIKIADKLEGIAKYAEQFLGKSDDQIATELEAVLNANFRTILAQMTVEDINSSREDFSEKVTNIAQKQLNLMGFFITSFNLEDINDKDNYLTNLGQKQVSKVQKEADIAKSIAERETKVQLAADNEVVKNEEIQREINIQKSEKEKALNAAAIRTETVKAEADAEAAGELKRKELQLNVERQEIANKEQARRGELELERLDYDNKLAIQEKQVDIDNRKADAKFYAVTREAEAEAESIKMKAKADADALKIRAEIMNKYGSTIIMEQMIAMMPELARAVSEPLSNVESIRILDSGDGGQMNSLPRTVTSGMANIQEMMTQMTGLDPENLINSVAGVNSVFNQANSIDSDEKGGADMERTDIFVDEQPESNILED